MKTIQKFILERLKLNKDTKSKFVIDIDGYDPNKKNQFEPNELQEISYHASNMRTPPEKIQIGRNGNVKLIFSKQIKKSGTFLNEQSNLTVNISKPDRYQGCWKITMDVGNWAPYEFPMGGSPKAYLNKDGSLRLPDAKTTIEKIQETINKRNLI